VDFYFILFYSATHATTWRDLEADDPVFQGEKCSVLVPESYGSYIYSWPSKYDQIFWPLTDENGIWFCYNSGVTAFIDDFSGLSSEEVKRIKSYLEKHPPKNQDINTKLELLEKIYALRDTDDTFKNKFLRVLARWHQQLGNNDKANIYRDAAFRGIQSSLKGKLSEINRLEYLYLAANYSRQFGEVEQSDTYLAELTSYMEATQSEEAKGYSEYLREFISDTKLIKIGGKLDPELSE